jgi:hypothetical protein
MDIVKRDWRYDLDSNKFKSYDNITVIDYDVHNFYYYDSVLNVVNEIYSRLFSRGIDGDLYKAIGNIVEKLNNLKHFVYDFDRQDDEKMIRGYLGLFDTFKYKSLSEFNKSNNIKIYKTKYISNDEIQAIERSYKSRFDINSEDLKERYLDYYLGDLNKEDDCYPLVSCQEGRRIITVLENDSPNTILNGLLDVFRKVCNIDTGDCVVMDTYYRFNLVRTGIHKEITHIINRLLHALNYLFNSTSFRENRYHIFDRYEVDRRVDADINEVLGGIRKYIEYSVAGLNL